jgi:hypothetical protein
MIVVVMSVSAQNLVERQAARNQYLLGEWLNRLEAVDVMISWVRPARSPQPGRMIMQRGARL